jgi:hypothetical protein
MSETVTARELQTLRNMGNEAEAGADEIEQLRESLAAMTRERDDLLRADSRWSEIVADELAESRRLMDLGGAKDDENFTTFAERVIAERDALRAEVERLRGALSDENLLGAIARGWCSPENSAKEMDPVLAFAIAESIQKAALTPAEVKHDD